MSLVEAPAVALAVVHIAPSIGAAQPFSAGLRITGISDQTPSASVDMTLATALFGGAGVGGWHGSRWWTGSAAVSSKQLEPPPGHPP